ncbi:hypothetical protein PHYBLDRAFT_150477 [Phycomyces blakesleeanus NRRL 1555(-)]|uniref:Uncharacterized protein n=1 Tax=Phycomyces blakesleeanus (strain ATCC 8743b / DSM 1359 / FGSC 10004 / NBRC 33097 / NRRL 1555) TaxID=763407 RepID=A0A162TG14_PHYB8|nr:hypothetical protein PHYBLDRAFT_150477 [Phycomyces blakesleeanus NRRL 1555(-)]OAD68292.1 hypothetical protein PHYBLDRAFT_150477 [Phycomyces blakesleeanus NRRL 1555(-)]|eukprot:XP_018286332.1 hypothetical protein PHYBLDRAFT_150477 [Phycomyces blakesleeanus NRRL 1555(-)]
MLDFGPVYAFWLYSFERYNSKLKNIKTNRQNGLEVTFMRCCPSYVGICSLAPLLPEEWSSTCTGMQPPNISASCHKSMIQWRIPIGEDVFVNNRIQKVKKISLLGQEYCSGEKKKRRSFVRVLFLGRTNDDVSEFPSQIEYLFTHPIMIGGVKRVSMFAFIKWFPTYQSSHHQPLVEQGLELWEKVYMEESSSCIILVHRLHSCFALTMHKMQSGTQKRLVIPLPRKVVT